MSDILMFCNVSELAFQFRACWAEEQKLGRPQKIFYEQLNKNPARKVDEDT